VERVDVVKELEGSGGCRAAREASNAEKRPSRSLAGALPEHYAQPAIKRGDVSSPQRDSRGGSK
jgi:hypothetical protein